MQYSRVLSFKFHTLKERSSPQVAQHVHSVTICIYVHTEKKVKKIQKCRGVVLQDVVASTKHITFARLAAEHGIGDRANVAFEPSDDFGVDSVDEEDRGADGGQEQRCILRRREKCWRC